MAHLIIDQTAVTVQSVSSTDASGAPFAEEGFIIPVVIPLSEVGDWLAAYDPASSTSPTAADSRKIARAVLDALSSAV